MPGVLICEALAQVGAVVILSKPEFKNMQASRLASLLAQKPDDTIESDLDLDELDTTRAELKARD